jgi:hypothetical protein
MKKKFIISIFTILLFSACHNYNYVTQKSIILNKKEQTITKIMMLLVDFDGNIKNYVINKDPQIINIKNKQFESLVSKCVFLKCNFYKKFPPMKNDIVSIVSEYGLDVMLSNLLKAGIDPNYNKNNPYIIKSSQNGQYKSTKLLLGYGANINVTNSNNQTAVQTAINSSHCKVAKLLIESSAVLDKKTKHKYLQKCLK